MLQSVLRISLAIDLLLLTGWATTSYPPKWVGDSTGYARANYECTRDSRTYYGGTGWALLEAEIRAKRQTQVLYQMCMESHGYQAVCPTGYHLNDDRDKCKPDSE